MSKYLEDLHRSSWSPGAELAGAGAGALQRNFSAPFL